MITSDVYFLVKQITLSILNAALCLFYFVSPIVLKDTFILISWIWNSIVCMYLSTIL